MKAKFTYKEFTLLAGIVVAVIIMLTLWLSPAIAEPGVSRKLVPTIHKPSAKALIKKASILIHNSIQ